MRRAVGFLRPGVPDVRWSVNSDESIFAVAETSQWYFMAVLAIQRAPFRLKTYP